MGWVDPWVGLGRVGLGRDFSVFGGFGLVGLGQSADVLGWIGSNKMDQWTTLTNSGQCHRVFGATV